MVACAAPHGPIGVQPLPVRQVSCPMPMESWMAVSTTPGGGLDIIPIQMMRSAAVIGIAGSGTPRARPHQFSSGSQGMIMAAGIPPPRISRASRHTGAFNATRAPLSHHAQCMIPRRATADPPVIGIAIPSSLRPRNADFRWSQSQRADPHPWAPAMGLAHRSRFLILFQRPAPALPSSILLFTRNNLSVRSLRAAFNPHLPRWVPDASPPPPKRSALRLGLQHNDSRVIFFFSH